MREAFEDLDAAVADLRRAIAGAAAETVQKHPGRVLAFLALGVWIALWPYWPFTI